jgi:hypothetical protein
MKGRSFLLVLIVIFCYSCRNASHKAEAFVFPQADSIPLAQAEKLSPEAIADISKNISSPVEIANLLQTLRVPFSPNYLATAINPENQKTPYDKALNLGILGADLGYLNMYEKTGSSIDVISSIRELAGSINVGQFFDYESIRRLSLNRSNLDSLLYISTDSYNKIDSYLRSNSQGQLSALMIIGVWIEGQYLATQVVSQYPDKILSDRIGEQKIILNDLLLLISPYCNQDANYTELCRDLQKIKEIYRPVKISYTQGQPVTTEKDGGIVIKQTETSVVEMSNEQLYSIIEISKTIRNRLISNN